MGNSGGKSDKENGKSPTLNSPMKPILPTINDYKYIQVLGRGGYGKVLTSSPQKSNPNSVQDLESNEKENKTVLRSQRDVQSQVSSPHSHIVYSLNRIITKKSIDNVMNERTILSQINHPYHHHYLMSFKRYFHAKVSLWICSVRFKIETIYICSWILCLEVTSGIISFAIRNLQKNKQVSCYDNGSIISD